jgi:hypothetical protein
MTEQNPTPGQPGQPAAADSTVVALGRAVERCVRRVGELDQHVAQLATDVHDLATVLIGPDTDGAGEGGQGGPVSVRSWLLGTDPAQAEADLTDLIVWLDRVYLRYHGAVLSSCWMWHPDVVEELWWLYRAHAEAYHPSEGSWLRVGDWHDRQRPGVLRRIKDATGSCELALHTTGQLHGRPPTAAPLATHAGLIAHAWTADTPGRPEPSAAQLDEAEWFTRSQHRGTYR